MLRRMPALPEPVRRATSARNSTIALRELCALGFSRTTVQHWVRIGLLERDGRGELRVGGTGRSVAQHVGSMVSRAGREARAAGGLACALHRLEGFPLVDGDGELWTTDHVAVPPGRRVRGVGFRVVRTPLPDVDHDEVEGVPSVSVARALVGAAATYHPARVRVAVDDAKRRGLLGSAEFEQRADALGRAHGAPQARALSASGATRMESEKERDLFAVLRAGDPKPVPQVWVCWHGRWFRLDFAYLEARLDIEYDGDHHDDRREADADRDLALAELQIATIRITKALLRDPAEARRRVLAVRTRRLALGLDPIVPDVPPWVR
ncbi:hypothetical protein BH20ACT8_BH20ACT8_06730 [soil metagenome]